MIAKATAKAAGKTKRLKGIYLILSTGKYNKSTCSYSSDEHLCVCVYV